MKQQRSSRTDRRWIDRAILFFCAPALIVGFVSAAVATFYFNLTGTIASILVSIFTILISSVGIVLLIYGTDLAYALFRKAYALPENRAARGLAGLIIVLFCVLLAFTIITALSGPGSFIGADVFLVSIDTPAVAFLVIGRLQQRQKGDVF